MGRRPRGSGRNYTPEERQEIMIRFLKYYSKTGVMTYSADRAGTTVGTIKLWLEKFPKFAQKVEEMRERFVDDLEMVAIERAKEKSDTLMALLLKANRPEKYRENVKMDVKNQHTPIQLVFSRDEWGEGPLPNYVGGATDGDEQEPESDD